MVSFSKQALFQSQKRITPDGTLTIRIKANGFVEIRKDSESNYLYINNYHTHDLIDARSICQYIVDNRLCDNCVSIKFILPAIHFSVVPNEYFDKEFLETYFIHSIENNDLLNYKFIANQIGLFFCVAAIDKLLFDEFYKTFADAEFLNDSYLFIKTSQSISNINADTNCAILYFFENKVNIAIFNKGNGIAYTRFEYNSMDNLIYHILKNIDLAISSLDVTLFLHGEIEKSSNFVLSLSRYFSRINFVEYHLNEVIENTHYHYIELNS